MVIFEKNHFLVKLLDDEDKTDPEYNYGVYNKEHGVYDVQTTSEAAAIMFCEQHDYEKERRINERKQDVASDNIVSIKPKGIH